MKITVSVNKPFERKEVDTRWSQVKFNRTFAARSSFASCSQGDTVFVHGGYSTDQGIISDFYKAQMSDTFDGRTWQKIKQKGKIKEMKLRNHTLNSYLCYVICIGGQKNMMENNSQIYKFDLRYQEWTTCDIESEQNINQISSLLSRDSHASVMHNKNLYVFGGYLSEGFFTNSTLKISFQNIANNSLKVQRIRINQNEAPSPRSNMGFCSNSNEILIFGGTNSSTLFNDFWSFNFSEEKWKQKQNSKQNEFWPQRRKGCTLSIHGESGNVFLFGGIQEVTKQKNDVSIYLVSRDKWVKIHSHTDNLYDPSPTLKKQVEDSPTILQSKRRQQKRKKEFKLTLKTSKSETPVKKAKQTNYSTFLGKNKNNKNRTKTEMSVNKTVSDFRPSQIEMKRMSVVEEKKYREFLNRKKRLLSQIKVGYVDDKRPLSPVSEALNFSINQLGEQKGKQGQPIYDDLPKVIYDEGKGNVIGKKPCARDGHGSISINNNMYIIGGDRHMVSFNDTHVFRMDKALESVIYYTK